MSAHDAHYGGNLVDGARMLALFGDVATELLIRLDGDEGLFVAYDSVEFVAPVYAGAFAPGPDVQEVRFSQPVAGRQFCLETLNAHDGKPFAAVAELDLLDADGKELPHTTWTIAYVDSEELASEDGSASNAIDGQSASIWHTAWSATQPDHPHRRPRPAPAAEERGEENRGDPDAQRQADHRPAPRGDHAHPRPQRFDRRRVDRPSRVDRLSRHLGWNVDPKPLEDGRRDVGR